MTLSMARAVVALEQGEVVAAATESSFGLLARVDSETALDQLFRAKPRAANRGVGLVLPRREAWAELVQAVPPLAALLADTFWPGALSIALPAQADLDPRLLVDGTVAVRLPGECPAATLARRVGSALTATSANPPGDPPATTGEAVRSRFEGMSELRVLDGRAPGGTPSTLVSLRGGRVQLVRPGAVPVSRLRGLLGSRLDTLVAGH